MSSIEKKMTLREPLARAKGHGSAKDGVMHWIAHRLTSIAMIPLLAWFTISVLARLDSGYQDYLSWLSQPVVSVLMTLFVVNLYYHLWLGLRVIVEDYVSSHFRRYATLIVIKFTLFFLTTLSLFAILKIALGA